MRRLNVGGEKANSSWRFFHAAWVRVVVKGVIYLLHLRPGVIVVVSGSLELPLELPTTHELVSHKGVEFVIRLVHVRLEGFQFRHGDGARRFDGAAAALDEVSLFFDC